MTPVGFRRSEFSTVGNRLLVIGCESERLGLLRQACQRAGTSLELISYGEAFSNIDAHLRTSTSQPTFVRFESTDEDPESTMRYLLAGADVDDDEPGAERFDRAQCLAYKPQVGAIRASRQLFLGQNRIRQAIEQAALGVGVEVMNSAAAIATAFDKRLTSRVLANANVPVAHCPGPVRSFDDVLAAIKQVPYRQVMLKLAHGSGATGIVAIRSTQTRMCAYTTAVVDRESHLWNTRKVHRLDDLREIDALVTAACQQVVHLEQWVPKATIGAQQFDLRVVVIDGTARQVLVRMSNSPFTNLHLGGRRGQVEDVRTRLGAKRWTEILTIAERAVAAMPGLLYAGVDVLIASDWRSFCVLEVNAFGDWHPDVYVDSKDTYDWELQTLRDRASVAPSSPGGRNA